MLDFPAINMPDYEDPTFDIGGTQCNLLFLVGLSQLFSIFAAKGPFPLCSKSTVLTP